MARPDKASNSPTAIKPSRPITLKHLAAALAEELQMTKRAVKPSSSVRWAWSPSISRRASGIRVADLGILQIRKRRARLGRNPAAGEAIKIKASKKAAFRAGKELKMGV